MDDLRRLAAIHADTSRLMGVDFVPAYRRAGAADDAVVEAPRVQVEVKAAPAAAARSDGDPQSRLDALRERYIAEAPHRGFVTKYNNIVFGEGDPRARLMFVGEAPGEEEDKTGRPFVGRAGQLLTKMIEAMGMMREQVYICNVLKTRPLNNATPTPEEAAACEPYLMEQIGIISPGVIVTLGKSASQCLLKTDKSMSAMRGLWHTLSVPGAGDVAVMPTFHPAYLLRSYTAENRAKVWSDLKQAMERLGMNVK